MSEAKFLPVYAVHPRSPEAKAERERRFAHAYRCSKLQPLAPGEAEALQAAYLARVGAVTVCPPAYLLPTSKG